MYKEIKSEMVKFPFVAGPDMALAEANLYMKECRIRHLPVMNDTQLVGVVSERDLLVHLSASGENSERLVLADIMIRAPFVVRPDDSLATVVNIMAKNKYGCALVIDNKNSLVGIFTTIDALRLLEKFLENDPEFYHQGDQKFTVREVVNWS